MKTRKRRKAPFLQSKLGFQVVLGLVMALAGLGFVVYAREAAFRAAHFPPDFVHPSDWYAEGCLAVVLVGGMTFFLSRVPSTTPRYRRVATRTAWFAARPDSGMRALVDTAKRHRRARPRRPIHRPFRAGPWG